MVVPVALEIPVIENKEMENTKERFSIAFSEKNFLDSIAITLQRSVFFCKNEMPMNETM
jgi:hypothetical protein